MIHPVDFLLLFALFVVMPIHSAREYRRYVAKIEAGEMPDRPLLYRKTMASMWVMLAALIAIWWFLERSTDSLGFVSPSGAGFWIAAAVVLAGAAYLVFAWIKCKQLDDEERGKHRAALGKLVHFLPQEDKELRVFFSLSATAGIVEEIIYRGFLIWCLALLMPLWIAVAASSVAFGLAHTYQGASGVLRTGIAGLALGILYVVSGSIWLPILAHFLADALQGLSIRELFRDSGESNGVADVPA
jgi:membrane protease YdiL (CAAX protease family)